ncbi:hypothetical protein PENTCL1PPCAC_9061, partial [Pristionchus entomophagus]
QIRIFNDFTLRCNNFRAVSFLPRAPQRTLKDIIPDIKFHSNPDDKYEHWTASDARRLMSKMLTIDPDLCTIADALRDPYVNCWHQEQLENAPLTSPGYDRSLDANKLPLSEWKCDNFLSRILKND